MKAPPPTNPKPGKKKVTILGALLTAAILASASTSILTMVNVATVKTEQRLNQASNEREFDRHERAIDEVKQKLDTIRIPPPEFEAKVDKIGQDLTRHINQTATAGHRGGGGGDAGGGGL